MGLCKRKGEKKERKKLKNGHKDVRSIKNNGYEDAHHEKKMNKIAPVLSQKCFQVSRDIFQGA